MQSRVLAVNDSVIKQTSFCGIISGCQQMQRIFSLLEKVATTSSTVLILGESGTGKELVAKALHKLSKRSGKMVPVNCGAIPEEILESELFGHEKGAFTGAIQNKIGRFQLADGGTIFLDEIGEMSPKLQVKLLRVLQEKCVEPVGSTRSIPVDVRVVAATNKDLKKEVEAGRFREDLFYRLQVVPVELPALRERSDDPLLLAKYFLSRSAEKLGRGRITISEEAKEAILQYNWPGNIRELENLMERLSILVDSDEITLSDLPESMALSNGKRESTLDSQDVTGTPQLDSLPEDGVDFNRLVSSYEEYLINMALEKTGGNKKAAARLLNLNRTTLIEKLRKRSKHVSATSAQEALSEVA